MMNIVIYLIIAFLFCIVFMLIISLNYNITSSKEKRRPFECGFDTSGCIRLHFCIKFFIVCVIFLIFDVEVCLILPLPFGQPFVLLFVIVLMMGLVYE